MACALVFRPLQNCFRVAVFKKIFCDLHYTTCSDGPQPGLARKAEDRSKVGISLTWARTEDKLCLSGIKHIVIQQFLQ